MGSIMPKSAFNAFFVVCLKNYKFVYRKVYRVSKMNILNNKTMLNLLFDTCSIKKQVVKVVLFFGIA